MAYDTPAPATDSDLSRDVGSVQAQLPGPRASQPHLRAVGHTWSTMPARSGSGLVSIVKLIPE